MIEERIWSITTHQAFLGSTPRQQVAFLKMGWSFSLRDVVDHYGIHSCATRNHRAYGLFAVSVSLGLFIYFLMEKNSEVNFLEYEVLIQIKRNTF